MNPKQNKSSEIHSKHIIVKLMKTKENKTSKNLGSSQREILTVGEKNISNDSEFLIRNQKTRRKQRIFQVLKEKKGQPRMPYIREQPSGRKGKQTFWNYGKLRGLISRSSTLNECPKEILQTERKLQKEEAVPRKKEYGNSKNMGK